MNFPPINLPLPRWLNDKLPAPERVFDTPESRMAIAIELATYNVRYGTGGPFGAAVFDLDSGRLLAPGVNLVTATSCSVAHAELIALMTAQRLAGHFSLLASGYNVELTSSTEPCAMCLGALPWAGIRQLSCGARDSDARAVGFDEGDKPAHWSQLLEQRSIRVLRDVCRPQAVAVLQQYRQEGGEIYNGQNHHKK